MVAHIDNANSEQGRVSCDSAMPMSCGISALKSSNNTNGSAHRLIAQFLFAAGGDDDHEYALAMAWVIVNRVQQWHLSVEDALECPWQPGGPDMGRRAHGFEAPQSLLAISTAVTYCLTHDPTPGAVAFHHHWEDPSWAKDVQPHALIGPCFFYQFGPALSQVKNMQPALPMFT